MSHRGPDDWGLWGSPSGRAELGHRRLAILDLSPAGHQPMQTPDGRYTIVFNGEIYNHLELKEELLAEGVSFRGRSDTEVILHLFALEGEAFLQRLNGIYALAIWDELSGRLFCARDPLGTKPFYWAAHEGCFHFASEMKAFCNLPGFTRRVDPLALAHHLAHLWSPSPRTAIQGIHKLAPGHCLWVDAQGRTSEPASFFEWRYECDDAPSGEEWAHSLRETLYGAVARQLISDVPVGMFLSGGVDSSAIAAAYRQAQPGAEILAFCAAPPAGDGAAADLPYAIQVAQGLRIDLREVPAHALGLDRWSDILWHLEEPQADPAIQHVDTICRSARAAGLKVMLSGAGGDDLFSGYPRHLLAAHEALRLRVPSGLRRGLHALGDHLPKRPPAFRRLSKLFIGLDLPGPLRQAALFEWLPAERVAELMKLKPGTSVREDLARHLEDLPPGTHPLHQSLYLETRGFLPDHNLNYTDKLSMAHGIEVRVPLLDLELVRLANRIPPRWKVRGRSAKWILKEALRGTLPNAILDRPKTGFGAPLRAWMAGPMREDIGDLLEMVCRTRSDWFEPQPIRQLWQDTLAGRVDGSYSLWSLITIALWADKFQVT